jgi:preprotein translocase subunit YajC
MSSPIFATILASAAAPAGGAAGGIIGFIMPMALVFIIFYFLVLRPQNQRMKAHNATINAVQKGDEVITAGGIRGKATKVGDDEVEVEIAQGVKVRVVKSTLSQVFSKNAKPAND